MPVPAPSVYSPLEQMWNADGKLRNLQTALNIPTRIGDGLAMLRGEQAREFVHVLVQQFDEAHQHACASLRIRGRPGRLCGGGVCNCGRHLLAACQWHARLHLADVGVEHVGKASGLACHVATTDEMGEILGHDRSCTTDVSLDTLFAQLKHACRPVGRSAASPRAVRTSSPARKNWHLFVRDTLTLHAAC